MYTILYFQSISQAIIFYAIIGLLLATIGYFTYKKAVASRKYYICPGCGESFRTEFMDAKCCKVCGTSLEYKDSQDVTDKTF